MSQVQHGDAVEFVLPGVDELLLDVVVALRSLHAAFVPVGDSHRVRRLGQDRAEMAKGPVGGCGARLLGELVPF